MPAAGQTSLQTVLAGLAGGSTTDRVIGTKRSGPVGIESIIEYRSKSPVYLNVADWVDTFLVITINGIDGADLRLTAQPNPGEHGETPGDPLYGGRTLALIGKQYAMTIWKLRDMQQGLRGSFGEIKREYPLIFHAADPDDDLMIMCKLADKIQIPDQQTTRNGFQRDFQITLRASNPRFLSVIRVINSITGDATFFTFDTVRQQTYEDFSQMATEMGLSAGYLTDPNPAHSRGGTLLMPRALRRNFVPNPEAQLNLVNIAAIFAADTITRSQGPGGELILGNGTRYGVEVNNTGAGPATGVRFLPDMTVPPTFRNGDILRVQGFWWPGTITPAMNIQLTVQLAYFTKAGAYFADSPSIEIKAIDYPATSPGWKRQFSKTIQIAAPIAASEPLYVGMMVVGTKLPSGNIGTAIKWGVTHMALDFEAGQVLEDGQGDYPGWMWEGTAHQSASRKIARMSNMILNPRAALQLGAETWIVGEEVGAVTSVRLQDAALKVPLLDIDTMFKTTVTGPTTFFRIQPSVGGFVIEGERLVFSFYARTDAVGRQYRIQMQFEHPSYSLVGMPVIQTALANQGEVLGAWTRWYATFNPPVNSFTCTPRLEIWKGSPGDYAAGQLPMGEIHYVTGFMVSKSPGLRGYVDGASKIYGYTDQVPYHQWADPATPHLTPTIGPLAEVNVVADADSQLGNISEWEDANALLVWHAEGGAVDEGPYVEAICINSALTEFGAGKGFYCDAGEAYSMSGYMQLAGTATSRYGVIEVAWYDFNGVGIEAIRSSPFALTQDWQHFKLENVAAPLNAYTAACYLLEVDPAGGDTIAVDKVMVSKSIVAAPFVDGDNEFGEWVSAGATKYTTPAYRWFYTRIITPRTFKSAEQLVKMVSTLNRAEFNELHMALSYQDQDNQLYAGIDGTGHVGIWRRRTGVLTPLAVDAAVLSLTTGNPFYFRARLSSGVAIIDVFSGDPVANPLLVPIKTFKATLNANDVAFFQEAGRPQALSLKERGARWKIDEWRYQELFDSTAWKFYEGAGTVTERGGKLVPLDLARKLMVRSGLSYKVGNAVITLKHRYETPPPEDPGDWYETGILAKVLDEDNWLAFYFPGAAEGAAGLGYGTFAMCSNGVESILDASLPGGSAPATNYWLRVIMNGNDLTIQRWPTDPKLGGAPTGSKVYTLVGAAAAKFGAGVKGEFGIYWDPNVMDATIDEFTLDLPTFDDIAMTLYNRGNFEAQTTIELTGPMTDPKIINETNGTAAIINGTVPTGETWVLENFGATKRFYRKSDGADRFQYLHETSMWVLVEPNDVPNPIRFVATGLSGGWDIVVQHRHTYM